MRLFFLSLCISCFLTLSLAGQSSVPCARDSVKTHWLLFIDQAHRFCFQYPDLYGRQKSKVEPATNFPKEYEPLAWLQSAEPRRSREADTSGASITLLLTKIAFSLKWLIREAPTGVESEPAPVHLGMHTFYYYGPGGGGVSYPDQYYFNLHGRTLTFVFDGPYNEGKSPDVKTKQLAREVLASFKTF